MQGQQPIRVDLVVRNFSSLYEILDSNPIANSRLVNARTKFTDKLKI